MKTKCIPLVLSIVWVVSACQIEVTPFPTITTTNNEITLAPDQAATLTGTDLTITFHSVISDERCPIEVECAASGPVTVSLSVKQGDGKPNDFTLQTFTDQNGRSPNVEFEGVTNRAEVGNYVIQIISVTPYPQNLTAKIDPSEYRLSLLVSNQ